MISRTSCSWLLDSHCHIQWTENLWWFWYSAVWQCSK